MSQTPVELMAVLFALVALWEWRRHAVCARVSLGVATVFALAAIHYPGMSTAAVLEHTNDGLVWLVSAARGAGLAVVMATCLSLLRDLRSI